jgi:hypothetical protein
MGRGIQSRGQRKALRAMSRGDINGKLLGKKGHRVTKKMTEDRRQLNKDIALSGHKISSKNFEAARVKYHSENPSFLHNKSLSVHQRQTALRAREGVSE